MESQAYPVEHFSVMAELARRLGALPAQVLEHQYSYRDFGSWWTQVQHKGTTFRIVFDGKERLLLLERASTSIAPGAWDLVAKWGAPGGLQGQQTEELVAQLQAV